VCTHSTHYEKGNKRMDTVTITLSTTDAETLIGFFGYLLDREYAGEETLGMLYDKLVKEMEN